MTDFFTIEGFHVKQEYRGDTVAKRVELFKPDLIVLDLVAHNDWKRPIYFAVSVSPDAYVGLEKFFRLEGLAYRLVPVKTDNSSSRIEKF